MYHAYERERESDNRPGYNENSKEFPKLSKHFYLIKVLENTIKSIIEEGAREREKEKQKKRCIRRGGKKQVIDSIKRCGSHIHDLTITQHSESFSKKNKRFTLSLYMPTWCVD